MSIPPVNKISLAAFGTNRHSSSFVQLRSELASGAWVNSLPRSCLGIGADLVFGIADLVAFVATRRESRTKKR